MNKYGIVLAGGGSKGAYQIGVWKALTELGIIDKVTGYSGTSIGALNAGLFIQGNYDKAETMWLNVTKEQMLTSKKKDKPKIDLSTRFKELRNQIEISDISIMRQIKKFQEEVDLNGESILKQLKHIPRFDKDIELKRVAERIKNFHMTGIYSREGLKKVMHNTADFNLLSCSEKVWYAACLEIPSLNMEYRKMNGLSVDELEQTLLATSAIPLIYEPVQIRGRRYIDGGAALKGDNIPVKPLYDTGFNKIIVVHLNPKALIDEEKYPNADFVQIIPSKDIGQFVTGTLDFSLEGVKRRMKNGYNDTLCLRDLFIDGGFID